MTGLLVIIAPAGVLAALILFRWARTLALFGLGAMVVWFMTHPAHAQKTTLVQCDAGGRYTVPDNVCDVLLEGFSKLRFNRAYGASPQAYMGCAEVLAHNLRLENGIQQAASICTKMSGDFFRYHPQEAFARQRNGP